MRVAKYKSISQRTQRRHGVNPKKFFPVFDLWIYINGFKNFDPESSILVLHNEKIKERIMIVIIFMVIVILFR